MGYIDATITGIPSPHVLPMEDLREMLLHIEETLPSIMHLPISSEGAPHFYRHLCTHILIADEQFLLLTDVQYRIVQNNLKYIKCLIWLYLMEIFQHTTTTNICA